MPVSKETFYESHIPSAPYIVGPKVLQLFPGDTVFIEVELSNGVFTDIKSVKENKHPDKTIEIWFAQTVNNNVHENMMLKVRNPFKRDLSYVALIHILSPDKWVNTSIIPVKAGLVGFEMWPDVIISIALSEWKFL